MYTDGIRGKHPIEVRQSSFLLDRQPPDPMSSVPPPPTALQVARVLKKKKTGLIDYNKVSSDIVPLKSLLKSWNYCTSQQRGSPLHDSLHPITPPIPNQPPNSMSHPTYSHHCSLHNKITVSLSFHQCKEYIFIHCFCWQGYYIYMLSTASKI